MNKKIISSALAVLMIAGSTSFTTVDAMPSGTVVIGTKSFSLDYANDPANAVEIGSEIVAGRSVYVKNFNGDWLDNITGLKIATSIIPAVIYKNDERRVNYGVADTDIVTVSTESELTTALANNSVTEITLTGSFTASPTVTRPLTINFGAYTLTGNVLFNYSGKGTSVLTGNEGNRIIGKLTVNASNASFKNGVKVSGAVNAEPRTWTESADGNTLTIIGSNGASIIVDGNPGSVTVAGAATAGMTLAVNAGAKVTNITSNTKMSIVVAKGATVTNIIATAGSGGSIITNHGTIGTVTASLPINNVASGSTINGQAGIVTVTGMSSGSVVVVPVVNPPHSDNNDNNDNSPADIVISTITVAGNAVVGATLIATPTPTNATAIYQWQRSDTADGTYTNIDTNSNIYVPSANDIGKFIKVTITGTGRYAGTVTSVATVAVAAVITPIAPVAATGMIAVVLPKVPASENRVMLTVSTAASDANHKVYYRVVSVDPSAMNVGDIISPANWTEVADTSAHETIVADGKFVEVVEVTTADRKATRWGKSVATNDGYTAAISIVVKNLNDSGTESLRQAIADIEAGGTVAFDAGLSGEIKLQSCININKNVKITGPADCNLTVSGENSYRIFNIDSGKNVEISYLKFTKGSDDAYLNDLNDYGGAIHNEGDLKINYSEFSDNNAFCSGGAITTWENSTLTINNSTFNNNNAGRIAYGGSIYAYLNSNVTINNSTFNGNSATNQGFGGAIWIESGNLAVNSSTISGNTAGTGGGICGGRNANITLKNTIVSDNGTEDIRGSVTANYSLISMTTGCAMTNSDNNITGQSANLGTLADNGGMTKTMMPNAGSPVIDAGDDIGITETDTDQRGTGNLRKKGTHLDIGAVETGISAVAATGMIAVVLPKSPAAENKVMLTVSTAASDANHKVYYRVVDADPSAMNVGDVISPAGWTEVADTSAHETIIANGKFVEVVEVTTSDSKATRWGKSVATNDNYTAVSNIVVTSLADSGPGSLRDAITNAHDGDTITFADSLSGTINLRENLPKIERNIKITGPSSKNIDISGSGRYQIFHIGSSAIVEISNLNLKNATDANNDSSSNNCSGAIYNEGNLIITNVNFSDNNTSVYGGAIQSEKDSTLVVNNSNFDRNSATSSTGIAAAGAIYAYDCSTTINNCTFNNNLAQGQGGAIYLELGKLTISNSIFHSNSAVDGGADIAISSTTDADGFINTNNTFNGDILDNRNQ